MLDADVNSVGGQAGRGTRAQSVSASSSPPPPLHPSRKSHFSSCLSFRTIRSAECNGICFASLLISPSGSLIARFWEKAVMIGLSRFYNTREGGVIFWWNLTPESSVKISLLVKYLGNYLGAEKKDIVRALFSLFGNLFFIYFLSLFSSLFPYFPLCRRDGRGN